MNHEHFRFGRCRCRCIGCILQSRQSSCYWSNGNSCRTHHGGLETTVLDRKESNEISCVLIPTLRKRRHTWINTIRNTIPITDNLWLREIRNGKRTWESERSNSFSIVTIMNAPIVWLYLSILSKFTLSIQWKTRLRNLFSTYLGSKLNCCSTTIVSKSSAQPANIVENLPTLWGLEAISLYF